METLFARAAALSQAERERLLEECAVQDEALAREVRELLAADAGAGDFLAPDAPLSTEMERELARLKPEEAGERIGPYKLLQSLGEGGFGTVWMAEQEKPVRRRVALKILKLGMDTKEVLARFEQERQALALMEHPNIARVFDAGATPFGRPFFVMELVRGIPITAYCDEAALSTRERLELFTQVCGAIQHAHQKGVIHRDIKPSNVLVTINDGEAVAKVIDFGVAKATQARLTELTLFTQFQQMIGTPLYMSPEQAEMTSLDIDTRSDIYSLGVLLYELLTGRTPIDTETLRQAGVDEIRRLIREVDPPKPSTRFKTLGGAELTETARRRKVDSAQLPGQLRGDLDWIVMRCLEKNRKRRYESAAALALDLRRHLANEIITARPPTAGYLIGKLIRRNRLAFAAAAAVAAAILIGLAASSVLYFKARTAEARALASAKGEKEAAQRETTQRIAADVSAEAARTEAARSKKAQEMASQSEARATLAKDDASREAANAKREAIRAGAESERANAAAANAKVEQGKAEDTVRELHQRRAFEALQANRTEEALAWFAKLLRDDPNHPTAGSIIVSILNSRSFPLPVGKEVPQGSVSYRTTMPDGRMLIGEPYGPVRIWNPATASWGRNLPSPGSARAITPDSRRLFMGGCLGHDTKENGIKPDIDVWDLTTGELLGNLKCEEPIIGLQLSPNGRYAATLDGSRALSLWDANTYKLLATFQKAEHNGQWMQFSRDGRYLVLYQQVIDCETLQPVPMPARKAGVPVAQHPTETAFIDGINSFPSWWKAFRYDGTLLAQSRRRMTVTIGKFATEPSGTRMVSEGVPGGGIALWDLRTGEYAAPPITFRTSLALTGVSPEGTRVFTQGGDYAVRMWSLVDGSAWGEPLWPRSGWWDFGPLTSQVGGKKIALSAPDGGIEDWTLEDGRESPLAARIVDDTRGFFMHPTRELIYASTYNSAQAFDLERWQAVGARLAGPACGQIAFSPKGDLGASVTKANRIVIFSVPSGETVVELEGTFAANNFAFSPDGKTLAVENNRLPDFLVIVDTSTGKRLRTIRHYGASAGGVSWRPDSKAVLCRETLWNPETGEKIWQAEGVRAQPSPDWKVVGCGEVLVDPATGRTLHRLLQPAVTTSLFSPDSRSYATGGGDRTVRLWDAAKGALLRRPFRLLSEATKLAFSPDSQRLAIGCTDGSVQLWDVKSGEPLTPPFQMEQNVSGLCFTHDGRRLMASADNGSVRMFDVPELSHPAPLWLADLAEVLASHKVDKEEAVVKRDEPSIRTLRDELLTRVGDDHYGRWLRWFFADRATRTISAFSERKMTVARDLLLASGGRSDLEDAFRRWPLDREIWRRLAKVYRAQNDSELTRHAEFLERLADLENPALVNKPNDSKPPGTQQ